MSPDRLLKAREIFEAASVVSGAAREAHIARECNGDTVLGSMVLRLIEADTKSAAILDIPLGAGVAQTGEILAPGSTIGDGSGKPASRWPPQTAAGQWIAP